MRPEGLPPKYDQPRQPRHRAEFSAADVLARGPTDELMPQEIEALLQEGHEKYGAAFAAYLSILGISIRPTLLLEFAEDFLGTFPDMRILCEDALESLGYDELLEQFVKQEPELDGLLTWDFEMLGRYLHEVYDIVERDGILYQFAH